METIDRDGAAPAGGSPGRWSVRRLRLRFDDPSLESAFRADQFRHNLGNIRFAFLAGIAVWVAWGLLLRPYMLALSDQRLDALLRFGFFIPLLVLGFALTFTRSFARAWEWIAVAIAVATLLVWVYYASRILTLPAEYGYVGVILILAFTYTLLRLRFVFVLLITIVGTAAYLPYAITARYIQDVSVVLASLYLVTFGILGGLAAYRVERFTRDLFLRERQLDQERARSDGLLLNILPLAIVEQLKSSPSGRIAQAFDQVSVVFADAVGSTEQAARCTPEEFADSLDELFRRFDAIADATAWRRSRRSETRTWPSPGRRSLSRIMRGRPPRWPSTCSRRRARSDGPPGIRSWCGSAWRAGRPSRGWSESGSARTTCGESP